MLKIMPWKNGCGSTAEIKIFPSPSTIQDSNFEWRLSSARLTEDSEFSQYPGYARILTLISGEGLLLNDQELGPFEFFKFSGNEKIHGSPIGESIEDLGVIYKEELWQVEFSILEIGRLDQIEVSKGHHFLMPINERFNFQDQEYSPSEFMYINSCLDSSELITTQANSLHNHISTGISTDISDDASDIFTNDVSEKMKTISIQSAKVHDELQKTYLLWVQINPRHPM